MGLTAQQIDRGDTLPGRPREPISQVGMTASRVSQADFRYNLLDHRFNFITTLCDLQVFQFFSTLHHLSAPGNQPLNFTSPRRDSIWPPWRVLQWITLASRMPSVGSGEYCGSSRTRFKSALVTVDR